MVPRRSPKGERKDLYRRIEKLDRELPIDDRPLLSDQLIQPLFVRRPSPLLVDVDSVSRARRLSIDAHAEPSGCPSERIQLMQEYVQKSMRTTFPRRSTASSGGELSHPVALPREWSSLSMGT